MTAERAHSTQGVAKEDSGTRGVAKEDGSMQDVEKMLHAAVLPSAQDEQAAAAAAERLSVRAFSEGLADIAYGIVDSPFGPLTAATTDQGLVRLAFPEESSDEVLERLAHKLSPRILEAPNRFEQVRRELDEYFSGQRRDFDVPLDRVLMSAFAKRVLAATSAIPYGSVSTYNEMAREAGSPRGSRAAGNALGSNPIPVIVPCHRVLRTGGNLGGYGGGLDRKRWLLELEGALTPEL